MANTDLWITESPSQENAAVLSAEGPSRGPSSIGWVGLGGHDPRVDGTRYVQIIRVDDQKDLQEPIRLNRAEGKYEYEFCWSEDEKLLD